MIVGYLRTMRPIEECQDEIAALEKEGCGPIFVDRDSKQRGAQAIRQIRAQLQRNRTINVFPEGTVFAGDEKLTTALLDRLAHHATVITTKGKSYRMRKRRGPDSPA